MQDRPDTIFVVDPNETAQQTIDRLQGVTGSRLGLGRAFEIVLAEVMKVIQDNWLTLITPEFKAAWIPQLENNPFLLEVPDLGQSEPQQNAQSQTIRTNDNPNVTIRESIRYRIVRTENAGFDRKMFSGTKELKPRRRYQIAQLDPDTGLYRYTEVLGKTWEYLVEFTCSGRTGTTRDYLYKCLEYIMYTNAKLFYEFGLQRALPLGSPRGPVIDDESKMHQKVLTAYFRHEEFYYRPGEVEITSLEYKWDEFQLEQL